MSQDTHADIKSQTETKIFSKAEVFCGCFVDAWLFSVEMIMNI